MVATDFCHDVGYVLADETEFAVDPFDGCANGLGAFQQSLALRFQLQM